MYLPTLAPSSPPIGICVPVRPQQVLVGRSWVSGMRQTRQKSAVHFILTGRRWPALRPPQEVRAGTASGDGMTSSSTLSKGSRDPEPRSRGETGLGFGKGRGWTRTRPTGLRIACFHLPRSRQAPRSLGRRREGQADRRGRGPLSSQAVLVPQVVVGLFDARRHRLLALADPDASPRRQPRRSDSGWRQEGARTAGRSSSCWACPGPRGCRPGHADEIRAVKGKG